MSWSIRHVDTTGSTNDDLVAAAVAGDAVDRSVLVTGHQTAGRGRLDRRWEAPPGTNVLASILLRDVPAVPTELTHRVGLAIVAGARRLAPVAASRFALKWPNDALLDDRKLAGVLAQLGADRGGRPFVVVGFGINVGWAPEGAARLVDVAADATPARLLDAVLAAFDELPDDPRALHELYRREVSTLGREVRVLLPGGRPAVVGEAVDVDDDGRLVVATADGRRSFDTGDVVHVRGAEPGSADGS